MCDQDRARFDTTISVLCDNVGACERIFKSPIPLVYTRHTSRYVGFWLVHSPSPQPLTADCPNPNPYP